MGACTINGRALLIKLIAYSIAYGLLAVNYIDLVVPGARIPGYHLWLMAMYIAPFATILLIYGIRCWGLAVALGLLASLMNDLFYYPVGILFFRMKVDLVEWYKFQLGLKGWERHWDMNMGLIMVPIHSITLAASIYVRAIIVIVIIIKWWRGSR